MSDEEEERILRFAGNLNTMFHELLQAGISKNRILKIVMEITYDALFHMPPEEAEQLLDKFRESPNQFRTYLQENFTGR